MFYNIATGYIQASQGTLHYNSMREMLPDCQYINTLFLFNTGIATRMKNERCTVSTNNRNSHLSRFLLISWFSRRRGNPVSLHKPVRSSTFIESESTLTFSPDATENETSLRTRSRPGLYLVE